MPRVLQVSCGPDRGGCAIFSLLEGRGVEIHKSYPHICKESEISDSEPKNKPQSTHAIYSSRKSIVKLAVKIAIGR